MDARLQSVNMNGGLPDEYSAMHCVVLSDVDACVTTPLLSPLSMSDTRPVLSTISVSSPVGAPRPDCVAADDQHCPPSIICDNTAAAGPICHDTQKQSHSLQLTQLAQSHPSGLHNDTGLHHRSDRLKYSTRNKQKGTTRDSNIHQILPGAPSKYTGGTSHRFSPYPDAHQVQNSNGKTPTLRDIVCDISRLNPQLGSFFRTSASMLSYTQQLQSQIQWTILKNILAEISKINKVN